MLCISSATVPLILGLGSKLGSSAYMRVVDTYTEYITNQRFLRLSARSIVVCSALFLRGTLLHI